VAGIRPFSEADIPQVLELRGKLYGRPSTPSGARSLEDYFSRVFLRNPWMDPAISSLVFEDREGKLLGFQGVVPRWLSFQGRPVQAAISTHLMVDSDRRASLAGIELMKVFMAGPQDLSIADEANDAPRKIWERFGGETSLLNSLRWTHILSPLAYLNFLRMKSNTSLLRRDIIKQFAVAIDRIIPLLPRKASHGLSVQPLGPEQLLECVDQLQGGYALRPSYDKQSLSWLLEMAGRHSSRGTFQSVSLVSREGRLVGWFLYYSRSGSIGQVLHMGAQEEYQGQILDYLFEDARQQGCIAVSGRVIPKWIAALSDRYCLINRGYHWMLIQSEKTELLHAIHKGDHCLSRLEGEWWLDFEGAAMNDSVAAQGVI
jgi:hypothetical protein